MKDDDGARTALRTHNPQANLQDIASELRLNIYEALWTPRDRKYTIHTDKPDSRLSQRQRQGLREVSGEDFQFYTALLRVNKQIYNEAVTIMHRNTDLALWFISRKAGSVWPVRYRTPTVDAKSLITSIRLSADLNDQLPQVLRFEDFRCLEKLQVIVKGRRGGSLTAEEATDTLCELIEKCSANAKLKSVAIEMSCLTQAATMDVKHTTIDKDSVRREAAITPDLTHKDDFKQQQHMPTTAAPPPDVATAAVPDQVHATEDRSPQASFMGIPPELRLYIYEALWPPKKRKYTIHSDTPDGRISDRVIERAEEDKNETCTALLRVNKQIWQEAISILHKTSCLTMESDMQTLGHSCGTSVTTAVRAHVTSMRVRVTTASLQKHPTLDKSRRFTHDLYPNVEKLQISHCCHSPFLWKELGDPMRAFILAFSKSPKLKDVAVELSSTSQFGDPLYPRATKGLCNRIARSLREDYGKQGGNSAVFDVLWEWRQGDP
ncbi:hypothetical protein TI39_contig516g00009 [Zymoseptoria brevis]|uniref:Uncharacterized protein n=1 Tax=Zymoseptoria brevis TaxID=1047168 RepID=A0A0F4GIM1_9PEZI|nr:hypothetical protein TI39_contig516g00009 [Zymoseptoria brevis]